MGVTNQERNYSLALHVTEGRLRLAFSFYYYIVAFINGNTRNCYQIWIYVDTNPVHVIKIFGTSYFISKHF